MAATLLLVEDDQDLREVLTLTFEREGFDVLAVENGEAALGKAARGAVDIVVLDIMLPGIDGIEVCQQLRAEPSTAHLPVLMVTAKAEESDVVLGLGVGADDYVTKPARPRELVARVKSLLRRARKTEESGVETISKHRDLIVDPIRFEVRSGNERLVFTPTELRILQALIDSPGRTFRRHELLAASAGPGVVITERNVDTHIKTIRQKLGERGEWIETVRGVGYRLRDDDA